MNSSSSAVLFDSKLVSSSEEARLKEFIDDMRSTGGIVEVQNIAARFSAGTSQDFLSLGGLAISAAALVVSILQLRNAGQKLSRSDLLREIDAYLRLKGVDDYRFLFESGFENISEGNGRICVVAVEDSISKGRIYLSISDRGMTISAVQFDWRSMD